MSAALEVRGLSKSDGCDPALMRKFEAKLAADPDFTVDGETPVAPWRGAVRGLITRSNWKASRTAHIFFASTSR